MSPGAAGSVRGVAVGGPEAGGMLGILPVMSVPIHYAENTNSLYLKRRYGPVARIPTDNATDVTRAGHRGCVRAIDVL